MGISCAETKTKRLGRYRVVKRLAAGGMADVLIARTNGIEGFERHVVIKRIHPELLEEERYIKMFLDEARLAATLHHHNIVQVNDIGEEAGEFFFAMEYVHGEDVRTLLVEASQRRQLIPLEHVLAIVTAAAAGLHHAHEQLGPDRRPLDIVHRDVSPANILVGFDGSVKVADFGIALAAQRAERTQSGVLKGKVAYMSPEQCNCERVDRRSDVFSLGIVLYELATVHPCFARDNDFMTMSAIVAGNFVAPSHFNAGIDPRLEAIIDKALAGRPDDRYQTADELRLALERYAATANVRSSSTALADYMREQFGTRPLPWLDAPRDAAGVEHPIDADDELGLDTELAAEPADAEPAGDLDGDDLAIPIAGARTPSKRTVPLRPVERPSSRVSAGRRVLPLPAPIGSPTGAQLGSQLGSPARRAERVGDVLAIPIDVAPPVTPRASTVIELVPAMQRTAARARPIASPPAASPPAASPPAASASPTAARGATPVEEVEVDLSGIVEAPIVDPPVLDGLEVGEQTTLARSTRHWWWMAGVLAVIVAALALLLVLHDRQ